MIPSRNVSIAWYRKVFGFGPSLTDILDGVFDVSICKHLQQCKSSDLPKELLGMEERQVIRSYKFGLCYLAPGQSTENEMFAYRSENASAAFNAFLGFMGEKIELKGWKGYRAGLDVNENQTGTHSVYTKWQGYEVMFHVSTLLPFNASDKQQLERKRHVGNDIVIIVFQDSDKPFQMSTLTSKQNHVVAFISPQGDGYK